MKRKEVLDKLDRIALFLVEERIDHADHSQNYWEACILALLAVQDAKREVKSDDNPHTQPTGN